MMLQKQHGKNFGGTDREPDEFYSAIAGESIQQPN